MSWFEKKFGKYAIPNLTLALIIGYAIGFVIQLADTYRGTNFLSFICLDPWKIIHGQVWRLITWVIIPPSSYSSGSGILFLLLMMWCCLSIGMTLERTWGTYKYNIYIFGGILFTIISAFISMVIAYLILGHDAFMLNENIGTINWYAFSTYYINVSIYLGFALTYPNNMVRLMFFIPIRMKWLGIVDILFMVYYFIVGTLFDKCAVSAALLNILIFWLINLRRGSFSIKQKVRKHKFKKEYNGGQSEYEKMKARPTKHRCSICGQTEKDNPNLDFRYCSKCVGNYEYCQQHLFTHTHKNSQ